MQILLLLIKPTSLPGQINCRPVEEHPLQTLSTSEKFSTFGTTTTSLTTPPTLQLYLAAPVNLNVPANAPIALDIAQAEAIAELEGFNSEGAHEHVVEWGLDDEDNREDDL